MMRSLFTFPNPVNEKAARSVAGLVVLLSVTALAVRSPWLLWALALGFTARLLTGPTLSVFGQLATRVIAPRLGPAVLVPGPPKRFAQGIGTALSLLALSSWYLGVAWVSWVLVAIVLVAATLESVLGYCLGCALFARLQRLGVIPVSVCQACADITRRPGSLPATSG